MVNNLFLLHRLAPKLKKKLLNYLTKGNLSQHDLRYLNYEKYLGWRAHSRARRKELRLTQKDLASKVGVSHVSISQWEKDETGS
ncbi:helix-turn-helix domain-containing protein [Pantoea stewartii]|uniref:helix-turn-helix domain-containing protein n=1 Tax=Pantoea stewartii TaxID=66269 RepID=UPI0033424199